MTAHTDSVHFIAYLNWQRRRGHNWSEVLTIFPTHATSPLYHYPVILLVLSYDKHLVGITRAVTSLVSTEISR